MTFSPIPDSSFFTIDQINNLFASLALQINSLLDAIPGDVVVLSDGTVVDAGQQEVKVDDLPKLLGDLGFNGQPILNLAPAINGSDIATVRQAKDWLNLP